MNHGPTYTVSAGIPPDESRSYIHKAHSEFVEILDLSVLIK